MISFIDKMHQKSQKNSEKHRKHRKDPTKNMVFAFLINTEKKRMSIN